mgnify:CR=1 FL=1|tara:strand:+ start:385 stop:1128 length:744 start_codon:yes stop_codon:yes gene_type:complete
MGLKNTKMIDHEKLHIVTFNSTSNISNYNKNIITNFVNDFINDKNVIITLQGVNEDLNVDVNFNKFYSKEFKLLILTNLSVINKIQNFYLNEYNDINTNKYGYQMIETSFNNININIYNTELIPDISIEFNTKEIRKNQIFELLKYICENKRNNKFHILTGCFYDNKKFKEMISLINIDKIITNMKTYSQDNYIFIYSDNLLDNLDEINYYLKKKFNIQIIKHNIYNLGINEHCPFETILAIKNFKN